MECLLYLNLTVSLYFVSVDLKISYKLAEFYSFADNIFFETFGDFSLKMATELLHFLKEEKEGNEKRKTIIVFILTPFCP